MMGRQFLFTWLVIFGAVEVYSQLQQELDQQGPNEVHVRVARSGRGYTLPSRGSPPPAHTSTSRQQASLNLSQLGLSTQTNQGASSSREGFSSRSFRNPASDEPSRSVWEEQSRRENERRKTESVIEKVKQDLSKTNFDKYKGDLELFHQIQSKFNDPSLQHKLKEKQNPIPQYSSGSSTTNQFERHGSHGTYKDSGPSGRYDSSGSYRSYGSNTDNQHQRRH